MLTATALLFAAGAAFGESPIALVFEFADEWTNARGAADALETAGFRVRSLEPDSSFEPADLVVFGSFASESPRYVKIAKDRGAALLAFIERGGVVLQFTQADQTEAAPVFLPDGLAATRDDTDLGSLVALDAHHPLLSGLVAPECTDRCEVRLPRHLGHPPSWETFTGQEGFNVVLAADPHRRHPVLLEAALGKGRLVLTSLFLDKRLAADGKQLGEPGSRRASDQFFTNLHSYVEAVKAGRAPRVVASAPYKPPTPLRFVEGSFTLVVLPDTQIYSESYPGLFENQTRWIVENRVARKIAFVAHLGDITNRNTPEQWDNARRAMGHLDGQVPYAIAPGNHDYGPGGSTQTRDTYFNEYFPLAQQKQQPTFGGTFEPGRLDNSYHLFHAGGRDWIVITLEFGPRNAVVAWANEVLREHAKRLAIIVTHAYTYLDDTRYDHVHHPDQHWSPYHYGCAKLPGGTNDGEDLWQKLVSKHENVAFVLSGHVLGDGAGRLSSATPHGNVVHQILANYQMRAIGGEGYMRLFEFLPDGETVQVKTYSPFLNKYLTDPQQQFLLKLGVPSRSKAE